MARDLACDRCSILFQNHRLEEVNSSRAGDGRELTIMRSSSI